MINIKTKKEIELIRVACSITRDAIKYLEDKIKPGVTTEELNQLAHDYILSKDATPAFKGFGGFPKSICTSINETVAHGIPDNTKLKNGDIISIDLGVCYKGYYGDSAYTFQVGNTDEKIVNLINKTKEALYIGIQKAVAGNRIGDISSVIGDYADKNNISVVRELAGHGIGSNLHEDPNIPNYGKSNTGPLLKENMVIAIEPMFNLGTRNIIIGNDDWNIKTLDGKPSAHFEHTILITKDSYEILTGEW